MTTHGVDRSAAASGSGEAQAQIISDFLDADTLAEALAALGISSDLSDFIDSADDAAARTALGVVAGGAGDIWVEKAGDTMTGVLALPDGSAAAPALKVGDEQNGLYSPGADQLAASVAGANGFTLTTTGLAVAKLLDLSAAAAGQIAFPSSQNASAGANVLDDYEEGTWTPSIGGTATYTLQDGRYTKIGKAVHVQYRIIINVRGTGDQGIVSGLPFTSTNVIQGLGIGTWAASATNYTSLWVYIPGGATTTRMTATNTTQASNTDPAVFFGNGSDVVAGGTYFV